MRGIIVLKKLTFKSVFPIVVELLSPEKLERTKKEYDEIFSLHPYCVQKVNYNFV
jgi:hypothetical protein